MIKAKIRIAAVVITSALVSSTLIYSAPGYSAPGPALDGFESICTLDESCAVPQSTLVAFKDNEHTAYQTLSGNFLCNPATFDISSPSHKPTGEAACYAMSSSAASSSNSSGADVQEQAAAIHSGAYAVVALSSGKALALLSNKGTPEKARVVQQNFRQRPGQLWQVTALDNGYYSIMQPETQLALESKDWNTQDGAKLHHTPWINSWNQHWSLEEVGKGVYQIRSRFSGKALDVYEMDNKHNADVVLWTYWGGENQHWRLVPVLAPTPVADSDSTTPTQKD